MNSRSNVFVIMPFQEELFDRCKINTLKTHHKRMRAFKEFVYFRWSTLWCYMGRNGN